MSFWQIRRAVSVFGTLLVGGGKANGTITFGSLQDTEIGRVAANHLRTDDALTIGGTVGLEGLLSSSTRLTGTPLNTAGGSALTANGDLGIDGSVLYWRKGGSIFQVAAASIGTIAV